MTTLQYLTLRAVQSGTFRRRPDAPPVEQIPELAALLNDGLLARRGERWLLTEDGAAAIEAHEFDRKKVVQ